MSKRTKKSSIRAAKKPASKSSGKPAKAKIAKKKAAIAMKTRSKLLIKKSAAKKAPNIRKSAKKADIKIPTPPAPPVKREMSKELQATLSSAQARHWLIELGGENSLDVIRNLHAIPNDEDLAKKLKIKVSDVRASLNKLHNEGLVAYVRDKNNETGWYSYSWVLNEDRIRRWVGDKEAYHHSAYKPQEGVDIYFCKDCGVEQSAMKFELAFENSFKCPSCESALDLLDEAKFEQFRKAKEAER